MEQAGYFIENCSSFDDLAATLESADKAAAVLMTDYYGQLPEDAIALTRSRSAALLILFRDSNLACADSSFDLVIPSLTPPAQWLTQIADLIDRSQPLNSNSQPAETGASRQQAIFFQRDADETRQDPRFQPSHEYPSHRTPTRPASKDSVPHS